MLPPFCGDLILNMTRKLVPKCPLGNDLFLDSHFILKHSPRGILSVGAFIYQSALRTTVKK